MKHHLSHMQYVSIHHIRCNFIVFWTWFGTCSAKALMALASDDFIFPTRHSSVDWLFNVHTEWYWRWICSGQLPANFFFFRKASVSFTTTLFICHKISESVECVPFMFRGLPKKTSISNFDRALRTSLNLCYTTQKLTVC